MKKFWTTVVIMLMLVLGVGLADKTQAATLNINRIKNKKKVAATIRVNQKLKVKVKVKKVKKIKWKTSNKKIATISKKGIVKGKKPGKVTITAKIKKKTYKCRIKVKKAKKLRKMSLSDINGSMLNQGIYLTDNLYEKKNILVSPLSLNMVIGMIANGTVGDISPKAGPGQLAPAVYINPKWEVERYLGKSTEEYNYYALNRMNEIKQDNVLKMANSVWYQENCRIDDAFAKTVGKYYEAEVKKVPFDINVLNQINGWVNNNTDGMIKKILDSVDKNAYAYILNALLFQGKWTEEIKEHNISGGKFTKFNGSKIKVKMMEDNPEYYYENDYAVAFEKTYEKDGRYSFIGILPKEKGEFQLQDLNVKGLLKNQKQGNSVVKFPKFSYEWKKEIEKVLVTTSLNKLFRSDYRSLRVMFPGEEMGAAFIESVLQACRIEVDEKGTKAAAVTATVIKATSVMRPKGINIILNRPFAYLIRDNKTGDILFVGKVVNPTEK